MGTLSVPPNLAQVNITLKRKMELVKTPLPAVLQRFEPEDVIT